MQEHCFRFVVKIAVRAFVAALCCACGSTARAETAAPIRIGVVAPLTGPLADAGVTMKNSAELAREAFDPDSRVQLIVEDDAFSAQKTAAIVKKLIDVDKVSGIVVFGSGGALSSADIAEQNKIPLIAVSMSEKVTPGRQYVYRYFITAAQVARALHDELRRRAYPAIALVTSQQEGVIAVRDELLKVNTIPVAYSAEVLPSETDFRTIAARIKDSGAPVVVSLVFGFQASILAKQLRTDQYHGVIAGGPTLQLESSLKSADGALEGGWVATADDSSAASYLQRYSERFSGHPVPDGTYFYDAVGLLVQGALSGDAIAYLKQLKSFEGLFGHTVVEAPNTFLVTAAIKEMRGSSFVPLRAVR